MNPVRPHGQGPSRPAGAAEGVRLSRFVPPLALAALTYAVWHRALATYFSQDDFVCLARVRGLVPRIGQPWRWMSQEFVWDLTRPFGVGSALPHHLINLGVHLACVLLIHHLISRRLSRPAAFLGAAFFAVHPGAFHALYWASAVADSLQLAFALAALGFALRQDRTCWFALPMFALSLVSKEGLLLLPLVVLLHRLGPGAAPPRRPHGLDVALAAAATLFLVYFVTVAHPTRIASPEAGAGTGAYGVALGANLATNLVTYLGWTVNFALPTMRTFADSPDPGLYPWSVVVAVTALAGCAWPALRARGWIEGLGTYLAFLLPVLLLRNHAYHYYMYAALAGAAICVAALADVLTGAPAPVRAARPARAGGPRGAPRPALSHGDFAWPAVALVALMLGLNGAMLAHKIETHPLGHEDRRADPVVDRALIARRALESLDAAALPAGTTLLLWSPAPPGDSGRDGPDYWARNVHAAVAGGIGMAVMAPGLAGAVFVPMPRPLAAEERLGVCRSDGTIHVASAEHADSLARWAAALAPGRPVTATALLPR